MHLIWFLHKRSSGFRSIVTETAIKTTIALASHVRPHRLLHYCAAMPPRYCEVALPVPLHSTFSYAVPASLDGESLVGRRVVVPFGKRAMIGVGIAESDRPPNIAQVKEIAELMDHLPALPPKLIELGH